ncbi:hypothetical protein LTR36_007896 [Oleoguttula mirabilis]|uniref:3'-5' exonuclease domain-containing protein n=1 Tax=Oleoguttula mirabilis TaxID=1507867 RepID=A0AAV9J9Y9_9PEZI|nr:hypothetical protein LTR36_007896 [Oleoguttula mirabilis]
MSQVRAYAVRPLGSQPPDKPGPQATEGQKALPTDRQKSPPTDRQKPQPLDRQKPQPPARQKLQPPERQKPHLPDRQKSLVNQPNKSPMFDAPGQMPLAQKLVEMEADLKNDREQMQNKLKEAEAAIAPLRQQIEEERRAAHRRDVERNAAVDKVRDGLREEFTADLERLRAESADAVRSATAANHTARRLEAQLKESHGRHETTVQRHSKELLSQRLMSQKHLDAELRAVTQGRQVRKETERSSYDTYRKIYDDLSITLAQFTSHVVQIENSRSAATKFLHQQPPYSEQIERLDPWFKRKYRRLLERLDQYQREHRNKVEETGTAIKKLRFGQQDIQDAWRRSAHESRSLTRYHRLTEAPSKLTMTNVLFWTTNDQPLRARRDDFDADIKRLQRSIHEDKKDRALVTRHKLELDVSQASRSQLNRILLYQAKIRDGEALRALLTDSVTEKEAFVATLTPTMHIEDAARTWISLIASEPFYDDHSDVSKGDQHTLRRAYKDKAGQTRTRLREYEKLVRKKSVLEQSLGTVSEQRVNEMDEVIRGLITLKKVEERSALEKLGVASMTRSSSFARPARAISPALKLRPHASDSTLKSSLSSATPAARTLSFRRAVGQPSSLRVIEQRIFALKKLEKATHDPVAREQTVAELTALRSEASELSMKSMKAAIAVLLQDDEPDRARIERLEKNIKSVEESLATGRSPRALRDNRPSPLSRRRARLRALGLPQSETSEPAAKENEVAATSPLSALSAKLNMQPTAAMQAIHSGWPAGYRHSHTEVARLSFGTEVSSAHSRQPAVTNPFYNPQEVKSRTVGALDRDSLPPDLQESIEMTRPWFSYSQSAKGASNSDIEYAPPASPDREPAIGEGRGHVTVPSDVAEKTSATSVADVAVSPSAEDDATALSDELELEQDVTLAYQIPAADYRNAVMASRNTSAAFWTYKLYKNLDGKTPTLHFCTTFKQAEEQAQKFLNETVIGFDIEWEMYAHKNKSSIKENVSLIQIAAEDKIGLFQIARFIGDSAEQLMPPSLRRILESDKIIKAGVNIGGDARRMEHFLNVKMRAQFELSHMYKVVIFSDTERHKVNKKMLSLAAQVQDVLLLPLKKDDVRTSAWAKSLNLQQVEYSASDAYAGFRIFHALDAKRRKMDPKPPRPAFYELHAPLVLGDGTVLARQPRKYGTAASAAKAGDLDDEADGEFFDAVESFDTSDDGAQQQVPGLSLSGLSVTYPTLPQPEAPLPTTARSEQSPGSEEQTDATEEVSVAASDSARASRPSAKRSLPTSPEVERADSWVNSWRAELPTEYKLKCGPATLRAWHLWHEQGFDIKGVASLVRDPPLASVTVASYILQAVKEESLPFDVERVQEALNLMPSSVLGRYHKIVEAAREQR